MLRPPSAEALGGLFCVVCDAYHHIPTDARRSCYVGFRCPVGDFLEDEFVSLVTEPFGGRFRFG